MKKKTFLCSNTYDLFCVLKLSLLLSWCQQWKGYCPGDMLFRQNHCLPDHWVWGHRTGTLTCFYAAPGHRPGSIPVHPLHLRLHLQPLHLPTPEPLWWLCDPQPHHWQSWWGVQSTDAELYGLVSVEQGAVDILQEATTCSTCSDEHPGCGHWEGVHLQVHGCTSEQ